MFKPVETITRYVLDKLSSEALSKRAELYRALAAITPSKKERRVYEGLANECDAIQEAHDQLVFNFRRSQRKPRKGSNGDGSKN